MLVEHFAVTKSWNWVPECCFPSEAESMGCSRENKAAMYDLWRTSSVYDRCMDIECPIGVRPDHKLYFLKSEYKDIFSSGHVGLGLIKCFLKQVKFDFHPAASALSALSKCFLFLSCHTFLELLILRNAASVSFYMVGSCSFCPFHASTVHNEYLHALLSSKMFFMFPSWYDDDPHELILKYRSVQKNSMDPQT